MSKKNVESKKKEITKPKVQVTKVPETKYSRAEIFEAASSFGESQEVVAGALRLANKDELTRSEIEGAIRKFKTRKVQ